MLKFEKTSRRKQSAFTIVELLIVIVVIGILVGIVIVAFSGISHRAAIGTLQSDLSTTLTKLNIDRVDSGNDTYPDDIDTYKHSNGVTIEYTSDGNSYCVTASSSQAGTSYNLNSAIGEIVEGSCAGHVGFGGGGGGGIADGSLIQTITSANCPTTRISAVDARDNHTYWVQKLGDDKCWMLTNLAYAGGGTNTYSDAKTLADGTSGSTTYTTASYYVVPSTTNYTTEPTAPSTSTDGTGQYGYLYNWCGAMGGQSTSGCANSTSPSPNTTISVCPSGWRLPTGNGGEFDALNAAVNSGSTSTDAGLRTSWLIQRGGGWYYSFYSQGSSGGYWSSTQQSASVAHIFDTGGSFANPASFSGKEGGLAVRCIAN